MRRRDFIIFLAGAMAAWPRAVRAQQKPMPVIGYLGSSLPNPNSPFVAAFRQGLSETGYVEGQNLAIEYRGAAGHYDRLPALAADLVGRKVDLIVASGGTPPARAAKSATSTIPIVFSMGDDPVGAGLVASLARPGGNLTGVSFLVVELMAKRLELLSELVPQARVIALLINPDNPQTVRVMRDVQEAARAKGVQLPILKAATESEIDAIFATLDQLQAGALIVGADPFFYGRREQLVALAARYAVPTIYFAREFGASGGLISYGTSITAAYRQLGIYAGKILKGAKPADLPVQQPTTFELVINLKTAKALGLTVPQALLARADEVIE
jgi:putative ABC transport system substrate-binding protein